MDAINIVPVTPVTDVRFGPDTANVLKPADHDRLFRHIWRRIVLAEKHRREQIAHMQATEVDLLGIVNPTGTDCERRNKRDKATDVSVPDAIYPFAWLELQKFASEVLSIVMPSEAPYGVVTPAEFQAQASALTKAFRHQGVMFDHRNNVHAAVFDTIALDLGAMRFDWEVQKSAGYETSLAGTSNASPTEFQGMKVRQLDPYNISYDRTVDLPDLALEGEWFAEFTTVTPFQLIRGNQDTNFLDNVYLDEFQKVLADDGSMLSSMARKQPLVSLRANIHSNWFYYEPTISRTRQDVIDRFGSNRQGVTTNHSGIFSQLGTGAGFDPCEDERIALTKVFIRLRPSQWGLVRGLTKEAQRSEKMALWEIHLVGPGLICFAREVPVKLDRMPVSVATMNYRRKFGRSFKIGEHAAQMGLYTSTILNLHKRSLRKGLEGGLTIYNPDVFNLSELEDTAGGRVAANMSRFDDDIRRHIMQLADLPDSKNNVQQANQMVEMLRSIFPTDSQPAMMGLDRATTYQAQAVMLTTLRSILFYAALLDGQHMVPLRLFLQHMNLMHAQDLTYVDENTRQLITVTSQDMLMAQFQMVQSQPLMGIDRLRLANVLRDLLNIMMQSGGQLPPISAVIMRHFLQIEGMPFDMDDYTRAAQAEQAAWEQQQAAAAQAATPTE